MKKYDEKLAFAGMLVNARDEAVRQNKLIYVVHSSNHVGFEFTSIYQKDWLYKVYPGGRSILSASGKKMAGKHGYL